LGKKGLPWGLIGTHNHADLVLGVLAKNRSSKTSPRSCNCKDSVLEQRIQVPAVL